MSLLLTLLTDDTHCHGVSIVDFEQINFGWETNERVNIFLKYFDAFLVSPFFT